MERGKSLFAMAVFVCAGSALLPRLANADALIKQVGVLSGTSTASGNFTVPQWDPNANPNWQLQSSVLDVTVAVAANVTVGTSAFPGFTPPSIFQPEYVFGFSGGPQNGQLWNYFDGSDTYPVYPGSPVTTDLSFTGSEPADANVGNIIGTGNLTVPYGLSLGISHGLSRGDQYNSVHVNSQSFTITGEMHYNYIVVPEPASLALVAAPVLLLIARRRRCTKAPRA